MQLRVGERCGCPRVPLLCGCGWGRVAIPECEVPETCPLCGFNFWEAFGEPGVCDTSDQGDEPMQFSESPDGSRARDSWARSYDNLNGAPESDNDR